MTLVPLYSAAARAALLRSFQYRVATFVTIVALFSEPLVYLVVWRTVAAEAGGSVAGFTAGRFAGYYIVWGFVRQATLMVTGWEYLIRDGTLSRRLLHPVHPIHGELGGKLGWAAMLIVMWLPIGGLLALLFRPELDTSPLQVAVFAVGLVGAIVISTLVNAFVGFLAFWLVSVRALDRLIWTVTLLLSGRLVPVDLLPGWARAISSALWLRWMWDFPIVALIGPVDGGDLAVGLGMQLLWIAVGVIGVRVVWQHGVRRYGAVGG